ncbi:RNA polymerase sigma factor [Membranihabitans marinus]|uniref:RNA polymerase sigma factor n=1 Tax=Membranihabitans marinus TaxID=1227546 RepID=UPI001F1698DD|nr:sigma-70 family RNA polymerase sigma factor [Membranihabitans marinus]
MNKDWNHIRRGDNQALKRVYESHIQLLLAYGQKFSKDTNLVEDAIQEIFTSIWTNRENLSEVQSIKAYLMSSLKRKIIRKVNSSYHNRVDSTDENYIFDAAIYIDDENVNDENQEKIAILKSKIDQLSHRQKEIIYLKYFEGMDYEEIAQIMNMQYQSVRNLYSRAISALRTLISIILIILFSKMITYSQLWSLLLVNITL